MRGLGIFACLVVIAATTAATEAACVPSGVGDVRLSSGSVHYELAVPTSGCPDPTQCPLVVLVAGYAVPMVVWDDTVAALTLHGFRVLRFDFYGRGHSARPPGADYKPEFLADQIWKLVTAPCLNLPRRFHIVASSMGGGVAAVFANRHPDAPERIVLVSPAGLSVRFPRVTTLLKTPGLGRWYFHYRFREIMLGHLQENLYRNVHSYPKVLAAFRGQLEVPGTADAMFWTLRRTVLQDLTDEFRGLGGLHKPTLVIWGDEDQVVPIKKSRPPLERAIPHLELRTIPGAAHLPQLERPDRFNTLVTQFLKP